MTSPPIVLSFWITGIAVLSAALGVLLTGMPHLSRRVVPFSAGLLVGVALFFLLPELAESLRWAVALSWFAAGFALVWIVDRRIYPICPSCSHTHDHEHCSAPLHGFAMPLLAAAGVHSLLDGWILAGGAQIGSEALGVALLAAIAVHKLPEGIALGVITRAALPSGAMALAGCAAAEAATIAGVVLEAAAAPKLGSQWVQVLLALAGGALLYLGYHAVDAEYKRRGAMPAFVPALTGVAGSTMIYVFGSSLKFLR
ncbi:MAG: ZIP family metal transporter [Bryobacteraceae bacterium]